MGFYFRKSVRAGPFRFNFSKGGVGASVGVRGLRIGTGPRGHYIHAGMGGLYYRGSLGGASAPKKRQLPVSPPVAIPDTRPDDSPAWVAVDTVRMEEIESGDVLAMQDESLGSVLDDINGRESQTRMSTVLGWTLGIGGLCAGLLAASASGAGGQGVLGALAFVPGLIAGRWLDGYRRVSVLYYDLERDAEDAYRRLTDAFGKLMECGGKWHVAASGRITDTATWKRNAGAAALVQKSATVLRHVLPSVVRSNVEPPALHVGRQVLFFMPDTVLVQDGAKFGAIAYRDLTLTYDDSRFIEDGKVPHDAVVVSHTWAHPNRNGGPDRRFKNNRQIPICLYETLDLRSSTGLNERVEFSRTGVCPDFLEAVRGMVRVLDVGDRSEQNEGPWKRRRRKS